MLLPVKQWIRNTVPFLGKYIGGLIPVANYKFIYPLTDAEHIEWSILDTFDALSPNFDSPQTLTEVQKWFDEAELSRNKVDLISTGIIRGKGQTTAETSPARGYY